MSFPNFDQKKPLSLAVPKGRILKELSPFFNSCGIIPEPDFFNEKSRKIIFSTNLPNLRLILVRSFDVANFVKYGAADLGICGSDVFAEFYCDEINPLLDLKIGKCRLSIAAPKENSLNLASLSHIRVATKYPNLTKRHFSSLGIAAEIIKLNGAIEIAPVSGLSAAIVDLVSSGKTLAENNLSEIAKICDVSSLMIANRTSFKLKRVQISQIIEKFDAIRN